MIIAEKKRNDGFTLTEIMIVVLIIGFLAAIVVPNFAKARAQARASTCVNNLRMIQAAKDRYAIEQGQSDAVVPVAADISPYFQSMTLTNGLPEEPQGNTYTLNAISAVPTCGVGDKHTI